MNVYLFSFIEYVPDYSKSEEYETWCKRIEEGKERSNSMQESG